MDKPQVYEWHEPATLAQAKEMAAELLGAIQMIDSQLAQRKAQTAGRLVKGIEARQNASWRSSALMARGVKLQQYRRYKQWIQLNAREPLDKVVNRLQASDPRWLMGKMLEHIRGLHRDFIIPYSEDENTLYNAVRDYIKPL